MLDAMIERFACALALAVSMSCGGNTATAPEAKAPALSPTQQRWSMACDGGDGAACARMMAVTVADRRQSDEYGQRACNLGNAETCEFLGMIKLEHALATAKGKRQPDLSRAARAFAKACELKRWRGCAFGAVTHHYLQTPGAKQQLVSLGKRAYALAVLACDDGDPDACAYLASQLENDGRAAEAKPYWAKGCRALLRATKPDERKQQLAVPVCVHASKLGVAPALPLHQAASPHRREVTAAAIGSKRIAGRTHVTPPRPVKRVMALRHIRQLSASLKLCLSDYGFPANITLRKSSRSALYDFKLLDAMRTWRYTPYKEDGTARPVCTTVTFVYRQGK